MSGALVRESRFTTFDGTLTLAARHQRPDRYGHLETAVADQPRIARGGGYAYSAASFGRDTLVQEMTCFNRFLAFDEEALTLKVEAGVRLLDIMEWAIPRGIHLPVLPGYPLITVGGCVAADVHGKSPYRDGTFADWVRGLTVFHPQKGYQSCSRDEAPRLFAMTCGGFGLTGTIVDITLQLAILPSAAIAMSGLQVDSLGAAWQALQSSDDDIAYSWHDARPGRGFGRGIVHAGRWEQGNAEPASFTLRPMTADSRGRLPVCAWNGLTAKVANAALLRRNRHARGASLTGILDASFPFASNPYFHKLFGSKGLRESQFLVGEDNAERCLDKLARLINDTAAPCMMISLKRFKGTQQSLSMSGSGLLVAIDCYRSGRTEAFMEHLDALVMDVAGQPNLSKDSRLPGHMARQNLPGFAGFERDLFEYDRDRIMRSELSHRLALQ